MDHGQNVQLVVSNLVDKTVTVQEALAHITVIQLRNDTPKFRLAANRFSDIKEFLGNTTRVIR